MGLREGERTYDFTDTGQTGHGCSFVFVAFSDERYDDLGWGWGREREREVNKSEHIFKPDGEDKDAYENGESNAPASSSLHHHLALPLSKRIVELGFIVLVDQVVEVGLSTELVHPLRDFVACCVPESREER
jgi:hypothetical protein